MFNEWTRSYALDGNGNRVSIDKDIPTVGTLTQRNETASYSHNRLTSTDSALYSYDNEGQLVSKQEGGTISYSFDKAYRLVGIGSDTSFFYDGSGNRLKAVRNGVETRYIYDANGNLLAEADANNVITRYYVHGAGLLAAITPSDDVFCYHYDGVGNTVAITDASETVVNSYDYSPFGMIISENESFAQPFKFVGKLGVMAESNGFYYMRARYYDPVVGRFISEDPLGFDGGDVNLYVYSGLNPLLVVDPWGRESFFENYRNNVNVTNHAIFGHHINTLIGLATSGQVARNIGTTTAAGLLINVAETGGLQTATLNAAGAVVSAATTMIVNGALVGLSLEAGIHVGALVNAGIQTYLVHSNSVTQ